MSQLTTNQPSFAGGELAPALRARVDLAKYQTGLALARNVFVHAHGGVSNRAGTTFVGEAGDSSDWVRLIPFAFSTEQTYVLEFGHRYLRVVKDGGHVLEGAVSISGATQANPCVVTASGHGFAAGDHIHISGVAGMDDLNGRTFRVAAPATNTFELQDLAGNGIDSTGYDAYSGSGSASRVYTVTTPYDGADLWRIKFTQSADVMTLCHPGYAPRELSRTGHTAWTLTTITFTPSISAPGTPSVTPKTSGSDTYRYRVTAAAEETGEESLPSASGSTSSAAQLSMTDTITISWSGVSGAERYNVYREQNGLYGWIGATEDTSFIDENFAPDMEDTPPKARNPFPGAGDYPSTAVYHQQRRWFGATSNKPQTVWGSQTGNYANMAVSAPLKDDDAVTFTLAANQVNEVRHLIPLDQMVVLTSGGEWKLSGSSDADAITPTSVSIRPQSYRGSAHMRPLVIGSTVLFVQEAGFAVRDLAYALEVDGYVGNDLSILAQHLFLGYEMEDWTYAQSPHSLVWAVRSDGAMLSLSYLREHQVWGWSHHDTEGAFESVTSVRENAEDAVYVVVRRTLQGRAARCIERLHSRRFEDVRDAYFVDCGLSLDRPLIVTGASQANPAVLTVPSHGLSDGDEIDISDIVGMTELNGRRCVVTAAAANSFALNDTAGTPIDSTGFGAYVRGGHVRKTVTEVGGLWHLEGEPVAVLADGNVLAPINVSGGKIALPGPASRVHAGLGFTADVQTLPVDVNASESVQNRRKSVAEVTLHVEKTRGIEVGPDAGSLTEYKQRAGESYGEPIAMTTGKITISIAPHWGDDGQILVRQPHPLPMTILAATPEVTFGD